MEDAPAPVEQTLPFLNRIISAMSEAVLVIDQRGFVVAANEAAVILLDLSDKASALRSLDEYRDLIREWNVAGEPFAPEKLRDALKGSATPRQVATVTTAAGVEHIIQFTSTPIFDERGQPILTMFIASDITHAQRIQAYWRTVGSAALGISTERDVYRVLESVLDQIFQSLGANVVIGIWRFDADAQTLALTSWRGLSEETVARLRLLPLDCLSFICEAARSRQVRYTEDTRVSPPPYELDQRLIGDERLGSWVISPLLSGPRLVGVMSYGLGTSHRLYEDDLSAITVVAGLFGVAIDNAELYQDRARREQQLAQANDDMREVNQQLLIAGVREQQLAEEAESAHVAISNILESISDAFFSLDRQWRFTYVNSEMERIVQKKRADLLGTSIWDQFPEIVGTNFDREYRRAVSEQITGAFQEYYAPFDAWYEVRAYPSAGGLSVYFRDVTERKRLDDLREDLIYAVSHDLRNPLTIVKAQAHMIARSTDEPRRVGESALEISKAAGRMNGIIEDLLDTALLDSGQLLLEREPIDLRSFARNLVRRAGEAIDVGRVRVQIPAGLPLVSADPDRLYRVMLNLISNASKYSKPESEIQIGAKKMVGEVRVSVADHGVGIDPEELPHLFERYFRAESGRRTAKGLGLGLYIAKMLVGAQGGRIWAESEPGKGSTFYFTLPLG